MSKTERYVAYYRMPSVGDPLNGDALARQRRDIEAFLDRPGRVLVGEFTEVMTPPHEGETSPAFDLGLACCRNFDARLICAVSWAQLAAGAQDKACRDGIEILVVGAADGQSSRARASDPGGEAVPYLRFGRDGRAPAPSSDRPAFRATAGNRDKADRFAAAILPIIDQIRAGGTTTLTDIASELNARRIRTARGGRWYPTTVKNILERRR
jgi:hypothetical protein